MARKFSLSETSVSLERYLANKWIRKHQTSEQEIANLFAIADRDIGQSQTPGLGPEWSFDIAYNAVVQAATAALAATGYVAERANKHMRVLECLEFTVGLDRNHVSFLDRCRKKRKTAVYEQVGGVSDQEAGEMIQEAVDLRDRVAKWMKEEHADLMP